RWIAWRADACVPPAEGINHELDPACSELEVECAQEIDVIVCWQPPAVALREQSLASPLAQHRMDKRAHIAFVGIVAESANRRGVAVDNPAHLAADVCRIRQTRCLPGLVTD